jgi:6,7-dimethyl-8-ribityllumazine synthase
MATLLKNLSDFSHLEVASAHEMRFTIVVSQWNAAITGALLQGAQETLLKYGATEDNIQVHPVPGSFELIAAADLTLQNTKTDAVICLGCVIQGETRHFDFICQAVATGLAQVGIKHTKPVIFGVLTTDNQAQAEDRAGGKHGNKGAEAAVTAIQMVQLAKSL